MSELERLNKALKIAFQKINIYKKVDMAKYLDYANTYFSEITNGKENLSPPFLKNISDKLNINTDWILTGDGEMFSSPEILEEPTMIKEQCYFGDFDMIAMPREAFEQISKLTETVLSQQRVIESLKETIKKLTSDIEYGENQDKGK